MSTNRGQAGTEQSALGKSLGALLSLVRRINEAAVIFIFALLCCVLMLQVIARFVLHNPFSWSEELARYCQVWLVLMGSAVAMRRGQHIVIDFLTALLPRPIQHFIAICMNLVIVVYLAIVLRFVPDVLWASSAQSSPAMQIPMVWVYVAIPVGGGLILMEAIVCLVKRLRGMEPFEQVTRTETEVL